MLHRPLILSCSPRKGGNCDTAATIWQAGWNTACSTDNSIPSGLPHLSQKDVHQQACTNTPLAVALREWPILPCISCGSCSRWAKNPQRLFPQKADLEDLLHTLKSPKNQRDRQEGVTRAPLFGCPLSTKDSSAALLASLYSASSVCIISPVYFYFFPAQVKALLDRLQPFWELFLAGGMPMPSRKCYCIMTAGRPKGEKLFEGSLLSLKCALSSLGYSQEEPLLLRGIDTPGDLATSIDACNKIEQYAIMAAKQSKDAALNFA